MGKRERQRLLKTTNFGAAKRISFGPRNKQLSPSGFFGSSNLRAVVVAHRVDYVSGGKKKDFFRGSRLRRLDRKVNRAYTTPSLFFSSFPAVSQCDYAQWANSNVQRSKHFFCGYRKGATLLLKRPYMYEGIFERITFFVTSCR